MRALDEGMSTKVRIGHNCRCRLGVDGKGLSEDNQSALILAGSYRGAIDAENAVLEAVFFDQSFANRFKIDIERGKRESFDGKNEAFIMTLEVKQGGIIEPNALVSGVGAHESCIANRDHHLFIGFVNTIHVGNH